MGLSVLFAAWFSFRELRTPGIGTLPFDLHSNPIGFSLLTGCRRETAQDAHSFAGLLGKESSGWPEVRGTSVDASSSIAKGVQLYWATNLLNPVMSQ